ncbi:MAG: beta-ketoacyl-[acyl-carrier-protein] synthase family protein [Thermodesulfobacteriota bacterium]
MGSRRVVITGMGIISAHGCGVDENREGFRRGIDSIGEISSFDASGYRGKRGGEVKDFVFKKGFKRLRADRLDRSTLLLCAAFEEALSASGLNGISERCLVSLGTTLGGMLSGMAYHREGLKRGFDHARPGLIVDYLAHNQAANLLTEYGLKGESLTFSDACASSSNAIGYAFHRVRSGDVDVAVAGGYDTMCEFTFAGFNSLQAITPTICRPFDRKRDGLVLGEGAAIFILEPLDSALARGAEPLGEIIGYGASSDAYHSTRPDPEGKGAVAAIGTALNDAAVSPDAVDYINAHGTATPYNDLMEAKAIEEVFGGRDVPVSSIKPMIGHLLGASGAAEAAATVMALREGFIPPNINCTDPDPEWGVSVSVEADRKATLGRALSNSFGFGGVNAALLFQGC